MAVSGVTVLVLLSLPFSASGCGGAYAPCLGTTVSTLDLHAELAADMVYSSDEQTGVSVGAANAWRTAIIDASAAAPASGIVTVAAPQGDALSLRLPWPLSPGQSLPIIEELSLSNATSFTIVSSGDATQAGAWLTRCPLGATNDPSCGLAQRQEVIDGTLHVVSVRPLRVHVSVSVSYGTATALAPTTLDGDLVFAATDGTKCLD